MLLIHGIGRSLEDWAPQYERLAAGHRVIALDVPGFGFSERPREPISLPVFARGVADTLDALGESRPVHVVGNSLGGAIGQQLLAQDPDRVASLALINSAGFGSEVTLLLRMLAMPVIGPLSTRKTTRASAALLERTIYADRSLATRQRVDHALAIGRQPHSGAVMLETAVELATGRGVRPEWRRELATAAARNPRPTLIMWGLATGCCPRTTFTRRAGCTRTRSCICSPASGTCPRSSARSDSPTCCCPFLARVDQAG